MPAGGLRWQNHLFRPPIETTTQLIESYANQTTVGLMNSYESPTDEDELINFQLFGLLKEFMFCSSMLIFIAISLVVHYSGKLFILPPIVVIIKRITYVPLLHPHP